MMRCRALLDTAPYVNNLACLPLPPDDLRRDGRACEGRKGNKERVNSLSAASLRQEFLDLWYHVAFLHLSESFSAGKYLHQNMAMVGVSKCICYVSFEELVTGLVSTRSIFTCGEAQQVKERGVSFREKESHRVP